MTTRLALVEGEEQRAFRAELRAFVAAEIEPFVAEAEQSRTFPPDIRNKMAEAGFFGRTIPVEFGGMGATVSEFVIQQEELGRVWVSAAAVASAPNLAGRILSLFASPEIKEQYLPQICRGDLLTGVAFTEPHCGSDAANIRTRADRAGHEFRLSGSKRLIDNAGAADVFIVSAKTDMDASPPHRGQSMFLVSRDTPGFTVEGIYDLLALRAVGVGWLSLSGCAVPEDLLVGQEGRGFYQMMAMVEFGRTNVAAICTGLSEGALELAKDFARERHAFGHALSENQVIQSKIADMAVDVDVSRLLAHRSATMMDNGVPCNRESSIAKLYASEAAVRVTSEAMHIHGGIGFTSEYAVERMFRDSRVFLIGEGTSEIQRMLLGREEFRGSSSQSG